MPIFPMSPMSEAEKKHAAALMRINHTGEICAQALYQGQALTAKDPLVEAKLNQAAWEETEHLAWTSHRVYELGGRLSLLNPLWYGGSLAIGAVAGALGDKWNLGFLAETERQVGAHLQHHLDTLAAAGRQEPRRGAADVCGRGRAFRYGGGAGCGGVAVAGEAGDARDVEGDDEDGVLGLRNL